MGVPAVWLADWSDEEDAAMRRAWGDDAPQVLRSRPLGTSVGSALHRLRSYPSYVALAVRGLRACPRDGVLVAWQPLAGAVAALLRRGRTPALLLLNPLLSSGDRSARARLVLAGVRRADGVVVYAQAARDQAIELGVDPARVVVVPLGVEPRPGAPEPTVAGPVLAAGRDHRDYPLLARAAVAAGVEVVVAGPETVPPPLKVARPAGKAEFQALLETARAVVVPLQDAGRQAGTLAVLDALAAGRPVIATRGPGTEDYVPPDAGRLVPAGDVEALTSALVATSDAGQLAQWARGARRAGASRSLRAFVEGARVAAEDTAARVRG